MERDDLIVLALAAAALFWWWRVSVHQARPGPKPDRIAASL